MILYLDASALVKRYVSEKGSKEVATAIDKADLVGTSIISRAEIVAALARAVRAGALASDEAAVAVDQFRADWPSLVRVQATELLVARADNLAWEIGLRGYDAVQLASALVWQDNLDREIDLWTFDPQLWRGAQARGLKSFPASAGS